MPKNRSARLRNKARELANTDHISYAEARRRLTQAQPTTTPETDHSVRFSTDPGALNKTVAEARGFLGRAERGPITTMGPLAGALLTEVLHADNNYEVVLIDTPALAVDDVTARP